MSDGGWTDVVSAGATAVGTLVAAGALWYSFVQYRHALNRQRADEIRHQLKSVRAGVTQICRVLEDGSAAILTASRLAAAVRERCGQSPTADAVRAVLGDEQLMLS